MSSVLWSLKKHDDFEIPFYGLDIRNSNLLKHSIVTEQGWGWW